MEFYVYHQLRALGVSPKKIYLAHETLSESLDSKFPFANAKILTDRRTIFFEGDFISADKSMHYLLEKVIRPFCKKIEFGSDSLPARFYPLGKSKAVVVDPEHQFGLPTIEGTNILAETIYRMHAAGEKAAKISKLSDLKKSQIDDALLYFKAA